MQIVDILKAAQQQNSSDIHIVPGNPVMLRIDGKLVPQGNQVLTNVETDNLLSPIVPQELKDELKEKGELDFAFSVEGFSRVRANVFRQRGSYAAALRILSYDVPTPQQLGIPQSVVNLTTKMRGLVLVTGATGSGKSTTLASLIDVIASRDSKNIITLEDPIEYLHSRRRSIVEQREVGKDTLSYAAALRATLHTNSSSDAIDRMIDVFPPHQQQQIRVQLSGVLEGIVAQHLLPMVNGGRIAAFEVLLANNAIRNLIREAKAFQIPSIIQTSKREGMMMMDDCILQYYSQGLIAPETAVAYAHDPVSMASRVHLYY